MAGDFSYAALQLTSDSSVNCSQTVINSLESVVKCSESVINSSKSVIKYPQSVVNSLEPVITVSGRGYD